jgi:hypothetical protein
VHFRLPPTFEAAGGGYDCRVDAITQDQKDPMPGSIIPMICYIILMTVIIVPVAAITVSMTCNRVFTVGGRFPMMDERCDTGNPEGGMVNASTWDWIDSAPLYHLSKESTTYAGVLLDKDGSMK